MAWILRPKEDLLKYKPYECPEYIDDELFTIKMFFNGDFEENPKRYSGGRVVYVDFCDSDMISLLEINTMLVDCGSRGGCYSLWYKLPGTTMEKGLFELETDDDLMLMCTLLDTKNRAKTNRYVEVYVTKIEPLGVDKNDRLGSQEEIQMLNPFPESTQNEIDEEQELRDLEGLYKDFSDPDDSEEYVMNENDSDDESFHSDASNKDDSDDDLLFEMNVDKTVYEDFDYNEEPEKDDNADTDDSSVYAGSDEERMAANSTDEDELHFPVFNEALDMEKPVLQLGMLFTSSQIFRKAVRTHAILERRPVSLVRNYGRKVKYICEAPCKWRVYASPFNKTRTYQIRSLVPKHTCMPTFKQKQINSTWLAEYYEKDLRMNPGWPVAAFHKKIFSDLKCQVSKHSVYRAKARALIKINGTHIEQFGQVWDYAYEVKRVLPESTVKILCEDPEPGTESGRFMRMYICLGTLKSAFPQFCRHLVGLDGCHLKGPFGGQLLAAVGVDANDGMYPIAWAVVESETTESWTWFLQFLAQDLKIECDAEWTFISDRQKGLINALEVVVPNAEHRFCVMHLYQNMNKEFKGVALRQLLWKSARATTEWELNLHMNKMKEIASKCHEWLMAKPKSQWTRSAFKTFVHSDMFVNNHCEVFNSSIRKYRDLPIITMFRELHKSVMKRIQVRRDKLAARDTVICPSALKKLNKAIQFAGNCVVSWSGGTTYLVKCTEGGHELVVDLSKKTCTCRKWDLTGIPCYHACACIAVKNDPWEMHINSCYSKDMYMKLYNCTLEPIVGPEYWKKANEPRPRPPNVKTPTGRPKKKRSTMNDIPKDPTKISKVGTIVNCTYCKAQGHNARTCAAKKNDLMKRIAEGGTIPVIARSTVVCKTCKQQGHNSRTCAVKKQQGNSSTTNVPPEQDQQTIPEMMQQQGEGHDTQGSSTLAFKKKIKKMTPKRKR